jgi:hypothetical protein
MKLVANTMVFFSAGSYSDYGIYGHYKVLKDYSEQEIYILAKSVKDESEALEEAERVWYKARLEWAKANIDLTEEEVKTNYKTEWSVVNYHPMIKEWEKENPHPGTIDNELSTFISRLEILGIIEVLELEEISVGDYNYMKDIMEMCS